MRKLLLLACLLCATLTLSAQRYGVGPRHELRFGVSAYPVSSYELNAFRLDLGTNSGDRYDLLRIKNGATYKLPSLNFAYTCRLTSWFELGFIASHHAAYAMTYSRQGDVRAGYYADHYLHLMPIVRFVWLRRDLVRMYSSVGFGLTGVVVSQARPLSTMRAKRDMHLAVSFDIVAVGISVGRRVFGFAEVGPSSRGVLSAGVGFRLFTPKQKRYGEIY